jgi:hypothetical protein
MLTTIRLAGNKRSGRVLPTIYYYGLGHTGATGKPSSATRILVSGNPLRPTLGEYPFHTLLCIGT